MSGTTNLAQVAAYPQLVGPTSRMAMAQALMGNAMQGPTGIAAQSPLSPVASAIQGLAGGYMQNQAQGQVAQYAAQQQALRNQLIARLPAQTGGTPGQAGPASGQAAMMPGAGPAR